MKQLFLLGLFFLSFSATAEKFEISGKIVDKEEGLPLESATVFVERIADSSLVSYTISDKEGNFVIEGSDNSNELRLAASFTGYAPLNRIIELNRPQTALGNISLEVEDTILEEVMLVANRAPVTVKTDTLEF